MDCRSFSDVLQRILRLQTSPGSVFVDGLRRLCRLNQGNQLLHNAELWEIIPIGLPEKIVFSPAASLLERAGGNAGVWPHREALMGVRAGPSHVHLDRKVSPVWGTLCKFSLGLLNCSPPPPPPISSATLPSMMLMVMLLSWPKFRVVPT